MSKRIKAKDLMEGIKPISVLTSHDYGVTGLNTGSDRSLGLEISGSE